jgi:hypothetical protein
MASKDIDLYKIAQQDYNVLEEMIQKNPQVIDVCSIGQRCKAAIV